MRQAEKYVLLTGSDLGNRKHNLSRAKELIGEKIGRILNCSKILETEPWGFESDTLFLNQAILVETDLEPIQLLDIIQQIELLVGRTNKTTQWTSRVIDIDILCSETRTFQSDRLSIPHKWLHKRLFALKPLCQLVPEWNHLLLKTKYSDLLFTLSKTEPLLIRSIN